MSKDLLVLADEYAAATATFARLLALKDDADSMSPIAREAGDKRAALAEALAALDTAQPEPVNAMLVEDVNSEIVKRYKVEKTKGGFWPYCVKAGDGTMDLFIGSKKQAHHVRQALQSACLDGAFMALTAAKQAQPERAPLTVDVFYLDGHDPFICGVHGKLTVAALSEIELDIQENPDFKKGDGVYSYSVTRFEGQYGFEGRCELSPGWELVEHEFTPIDEGIKQGGQQ